MVAVTFMLRACLLSGNSYEVTQSCIDNSGFLFYEEAWPDAAIRVNTGHIVLSRQQKSVLRRA
jgi:hypothetical protein